MSADLLAFHLKAEKISFEREVCFALPRRWRFDFVLADRMAVEIDGGNRMIRYDKNGRPFPVGRHVTDKDYEKLNSAALLGYKVMRFSPRQVKQGLAIATIKLLYGQEIVEV